MAFNIKSGTEAEWRSPAALTLEDGEPGYGTDSHVLKFGDGATSWASLPSVGEVSPTQINDVVFTTVQTAVAALATPTRFDSASVKFAVTDTAGYMSWVQIGPDGRPTVASAGMIYTAIAPAVLAAINFTVSSLPVPVAYTDIGSRALAFVDAAGRVSDLELGQDGHITDRVIALWRARIGTASQEVIDARGARADLKTRLAQGLTSYGTPVGYDEAGHMLRWTRMLTQRILNGDTPTKFPVALIGDSYTFARGRWSGAYWKALKTKYGDGGVGWIGFANSGMSQGPNGSPRDDWSVLYGGTWTCTNTEYWGGRGPDIGELYSTTAGSTIECNMAAGQTSVQLGYVANDAQVTYRWGSTADVPLTLSGTAGTFQLVTLNPPGSATKLTITVVSGTVTLCGVLAAKSGADGVVVHKLGSTGSRAEHWAARAATADWRNGIAALAPKLVTILLGTNDQTTARTPDQLAADIGTIITNLKAALTAGSFDVLVIMPADNQRGLAPTMPQYVEAVRPVALAAGAAFLNLQPLFGDNPADYASGSSRPWYNADQVHPEPDTGGKVIADAVYRTTVNR